MNSVGGGGFNRNFSGPAIGGMNNGGFQGGMGGFPNGNMGNNFNRGGIMNGMRGGFNNMRGGRGGMGAGMMNMPGMGMNGMGGMANGMMNMPMMGGMGGMGGMQGKGLSTNYPQHQVAASPSPIYVRQPQQVTRQTSIPAAANNTFAGCTKEQPWGGYGHEKSSSAVIAVPASSPAVPAFPSAAVPPVNPPPFLAAPTPFLAGPAPLPNKIHPSLPPRPIFRQFPNDYALYQQGVSNHVHLAKQNPYTGAGFPSNGMPGMAHFNPAFFQQNQAAGGAGGGDQWQNPHGVKRQRPE